MADVIRLSLVQPERRRGWSG